MYPVTLRGGLQVPTCAVGIVVLSTVDALVAARVLTLGCFLELSRNAAIGASGDDKLLWKTKTGLFFANFHIHRSFLARRALLRLEKATLGILEKRQKNVLKKPAKSSCSQRPNLG